MLGVLCIIGCPVQLIREVFSRLHLSSSSTHLPRFEALAYVLPHFDEVPHVVIRASSAFIILAFAEVFYSVFVRRSPFKSLLNLRKAYIFQELLKVCYRSVLAKSFKTFIFQKFRRPLCHKVNLPRCEARRRLVIFSAPDKRTF